MKLETILPFAKIGIAVLAGVMGGTGATMAYKSTGTTTEAKCPMVQVDCKHPAQPPLKIELICPKSRDRLTGFTE